MWKKIALFSILLSVCLWATSCKNTTNEVKEPGFTVKNLETTDAETIKGFSFEGLGKDLEVITTTDEYSNILKYTRNKVDFARQGLFLRKDSLGRLLEAANYLNDTLDGTRVIYYPETGNKQIVEHYKKGNFDGIFQAFYPNGTLEQQGIYIHNVMDSIWVRYYDTGQLKEEVMFRDNEENGPFKEYHPNGNLKSEGFFKEGDNEHGSLKLYNEQGELVKTMNCKNGICKTIWKKGEIQ